jgi:alpha-L-fucosidase
MKNEITNTIILLAVLMVLASIVIIADAAVPEAIPATISDRATRLENLAPTLDARLTEKFASLIKASVPGPFLVGDWGFSRAKGSTVYLFIRNWQPGHSMQFPNSELPLVKGTGKALTGGKVSIEWAIGIQIFMDRAERDPVATVIEYEVEGNAEKMHKVSVPDWRDPALNADKDAIAAWRQLKFGLFIHWGPCSVAGEEIGWSRKGSKMGRIRYGGSGVNGTYQADPVYDNLYKQFSNENFDAEKWAAMAKAAGMKYMIPIMKHHDGFCMFGTATTDHNILSTPYGKDTAKELADACHKNGLKLGWYYSPRDWYDRDFGRESTHDKYCEMYLTHLKELCSNYGQIDMLWFDCLDSPQYLWKNTPEESVRLIRKLQPGIVINDRSGLRGDFDTPEGRIGGFDRERPWETCISITQGWSWHPNTTTCPLKTLIQQLVNTVGRDGNLLLNVPPKADGTFEPDKVARLKEMGVWLEKNGESIYGTRGGPFLPAKNFASTCKDHKIYLHLLNGRKEIAIPDLKEKVVSVKLLDGNPLAVVKRDGGNTIRLDDKNVNDTDTIVLVELAGASESIEPISALDPAK